MGKIDENVIKTTKYITACTIVLSALMQAVFLVIGKWSLSVLFGNLLGAGAAILNFFLMGLTVQRAVLKEEKDAKSLMKFSQLYRSIMLLVVAVLGVILPCFNTWTTIIPLFFPRIAIMLWGRKKD